MKMLAEINNDQIKKLKELLDFVWEMQRVKRVVGFKRREDMWEGLIAPSAELLRTVEFKAGAQVVDVGSGVGFPGMAMVIMRPDLHLTLLDASTRKCTIMEEIKRKLSLDIKVECGKAEEAQWAGRFDTAVAMWLGKMDWALGVMRKMVRLGGLVAIITGLGDRTGTLPSGFGQKALDEYHTVVSGIVSRET